LTQIIFDGGIFALLLAIGFTCLVLYRKIGAVILAISVIAFLVSGLVVITGQDVAFFKSENPSNMTITTTNGTYTTTTTYHNIQPSNQTSYLIGNGQFPIQGIDRQIFGWSLFVLSIIIAVVFLDQTLKGRLILGD